MYQSMYWFTDRWEVDQFPLPISLKADTKRMDGLEMILLGNGLVAILAGESELDPGLDSALDSGLLELVVNGL